MATVFFTSLSSTSSSSSSTTATASTILHRHNVRTQFVLRKAIADSPPPSPSILSKRSLSIGLTATFLLSSVAGNNRHYDANAAILEAEDDEELLEKVKRDRKKRLERQAAISSSNKETAYLQDLVYKLSKIGQAIEKNDLPTASSVLGQSIDTEWVKKVNAAFNKFSYSSEEKTEVDMFNSSLASLISSVTGNDIEASKTAFVSSASAFEKWTNLTGVAGQLKGL